ncbi:NFACT RNA binding domain-containing protein [Herbivorax sp. ANBcel31]|uniref:Rqc2 family fibronectin-binding protein n=1 Tax=Herbivorax sp. ANBcel31 TaxID=3069754 RepID=UPI0027B041A2|nr:NFACT RNA binding domain-containing protein [Herbivorax sp. ANBcel31]MDQ2087163.1 NFACT RNA binding domain-containing protein [Herbivorax sp. ANBcel31]
MPFDGIVTKSIVDEMSQILVGGRIDKIYQPEHDEILINIRAQGKNLRLVISANTSYPRIHFTKHTKENPVSPPVFCMLLRKHLAGGKITDVIFHDFERIVTLNIDSLNELGDLTHKKLVAEVMGKHSNIILLNAENKIIDSIKHVDKDTSSIREIMPARQYSLPPAQNKISPKDFNVDCLFNKIKDQSNMQVSKFLLSNIKGFSPLLCKEACFCSEIEPDTLIEKLSDKDVKNLKLVLNDMTKDIVNSNFTPCIIWNSFDSLKPLDFHSFKITQYENIEYFQSISHVLDMFYSSKDNIERLVQKKSSLFKVLNKSINRCNKKITIFQDAIRKAAKRDRYKLFGELITANIYCIPKNLEKVSLLNYYSNDNEYIEIPLDKTLSPQQNAQKYFKKYTKSKRADIHAKEQLKETRLELEYLESVFHNLENCKSLSEIDEIRQELILEGYLKDKKKKKNKKDALPSSPLKYKSSDGTHIYVGKNNVQNDKLTFKISSSNDIWLHTKEIPGSHVIIRKEKCDISDNTLLEGALLAAYHSKAKMSAQVEVDYTTVKNVKKLKGAQPGMVTYENHKTIVTTPDEELVNKLKTNI